MHLESHYTFSNGQAAGKRNFATPERPVSLFTINDSNKFSLSDVSTLVLFKACVLQFV